MTFMRVLLFSGKNKLLLNQASQSSHTKLWLAKILYSSYLSTIFKALLFHSLLEIELDIITLQLICRYHRWGNLGGVIKGIYGVSGHEAYTVFVR